MRVRVRARLALLLGWVCARARKQAEMSGPGYSNVPFTPPRSISFAHPVTCPILHIGSGTSKPITHRASRRRMPGLRTIRSESVRLLRVGLVASSCTAQTWTGRRAADCLGYSSRTRTGVGRTVARRILRRVQRRRCRQMQRCSARRDQQKPGNLILWAVSVGRREDVAY